MRPAPNPWPNSETAKGVLFVAQLLKELLDPEAFESFRAMTMDTVSRLTEAIQICRDIQRERLPRSALDPIIAELRWSLGKDPILNQLAADETVEFLEVTKRQPENIRSLRRFLVLLRKRIIAAYKSTIEDHILSLIADPQKRIDLRHAVGFYCSHMITLGYSKSFLLRNVEEAFFSKPLTRATSATLRSFFDRFKGGDNKYIVHTGVNEELFSYMKSIGSVAHVGFSSLSTHAKADCSNHPTLSNATHFVTHTIDALDPDRAAEMAHEILNTVQSLSLLAPREMGFQWHREMYVSKARSSKGTFSVWTPIPINKPLPVYRRKSAPPGGARVAKSMRSATKVFSQFDRTSTQRLMGALNTSSLARSTSSTENQLISLWSAFEVLLGDPTPGTPRIVHYVNLLAPCICLRYARRQFVAVADQLAVSYKLRLRRVITSEQNFPDADPHTKFAAIICCENNQHLRDSLLSICSENPLALHRLWKLQRDFGTAKSLQQSVNNHFDRVSWQIQRIYRARNNLVHSGVRPAYIDALILNALEYFRSSIGIIISRASRDIGQSNIDQVVHELGIQYQIQARFIDRLPKNGPMTNDAIVRAFGPA